MPLTFDTFEPQSLTDLPQADVEQTLERISSQLQESHPNLDLKRGLFHDSLLHLHAILETSLRVSLQRYLDSRSLLQISENPELATAGVVDAVLSNWGVTRKVGTKATGSIVIELSIARSVTIPAGFVFESSGYSYVSLATYTARTNAGQVTAANDRLLQPLSNGNHAFVINVEAVSAGSAQKLNTGTRLTPNSAIASYVTSYVRETFSDGTNTETNAELVSSLQAGIAAKTISNRVNMRAYLRDLPQFDTVTNQSIIGFGDAEMLRDRHNIFGCSVGGRVDWYCRGQQALERKSIAVSASLLSIIDNTTSEWQFSISRDSSPGFYEVSAIRRSADSAEQASFAVASDDRGLDLTGDSYVPDIVGNVEGAYTRYQTSVIRFTDTRTVTSSLAVGDRSDYVCETTGTPLIAELQDYFSSRDFRSYGADLLLRSPVPCFVRVGLTINKTVGDADPDVVSIRNHVVTLINNTGFIGRLDGSRIVDVVHNFLSDNLSITSLDLFGRIRRPDGSMLRLRNPDSLIVPNEPDRLVTASTVQFFAEPSDITVNIQSVIPATA